MSSRLYSRGIVVAAALGFGGALLTHSRVDLAAEGEAGQGTDAQRAGQSSDAGGAVSEARVAEMEKRIAALEAALEKLRADVPQMVAVNFSRAQELAKMGDAVQARTYPNPVGFYQRGQASPNAPRTAPKKEISPAPSRDGE